MPLNVPLVDTFAPSRDAFGQLQNALASGPAFQMNKLKLSEAQRNQAELRELQILMAQTPPGPQRQLAALNWMESKGHIEEAEKLRSFRQQRFNELYQHDPDAAAKLFPDLGVDPKASNLKVGEKIAGTRNIPYQMGGKRGFMQAEQTPEEMQKEAEFKARGSMQGGIKTPEQLQSDVTQAGAIETAKQAARPIKPDQSISNTELFMKDPAAFERMKDTEARVGKKYQSDPVSVSDADISALAQQILSGKLAPSQLPGGMGRNSVKARVFSKVTALDPNFSFQEAESGYKFGSATGTQNTIRYMDSVDKSVDTLSAISKKLARSNIKILNKAQLAVMEQSGNPDVVAFNTAQVELADQVAKILQGGGTGSGTSDAKLKQAIEIFDRSYSPAQLESAMGVIKGLIRNRKESMTKGTFMEQKGPKPGAVEQGYRFKGGDPAKKENWEKI